MYSFNYMGETNLQIYSGSELYNTVSQLIKGLAYPGLFFSTKNKQTNKQKENKTKQGKAFFKNFNDVYQKNLRKIADRCFTTRWIGSL